MPSPVLHDHELEKTSTEGEVSPTCHEVFTLKLSHARDWCWTQFPPTLQAIGCGCGYLDKVCHGDGDGASVPLPWEFLLRKPGALAINPETAMPTTTLNCTTRATSSRRLRQLICVSTPRLGNGCVHNAALYCSHSTPNLPWSLRGALCASHLARTGPPNAPLN